MPPVFLKDVEIAVITSNSVVVTLSPPSVIPWIRFLIWGGKSTNGSSFLPILVTRSIFVSIGISLPASSLVTSFKSSNCFWSWRAASSPKLTSIRFLPNPFKNPFSSIISCCRFPCNWGIKLSIHSLESIPVNFSSSSATPEIDFL